MPNIFVFARFKVKKDDFESNHGCVAMWHWKASEGMIKIECRAHTMKREHSRNLILIQCHQIKWKFPYNRPPGHHAQSSCGLIVVV